MALKQFVNGFGMVLLFGAAIFIFTSEFIISNNASSNVYNNPTFNSTRQSFISSTSAIQDYADTSKETLEKYSPSVAFLFLIAYSAFKIPMLLLNFFLSGISTIGTTLYTFLYLGTKGSNSFGIVFAVFQGLLLIGIIFAIIKMFRTGESER